MNVVPNQVITPEVRDPNRIPETFANGPLNVTTMGNVSVLTFTQVRPDAGQLFKSGAKAENLSAVVVSRVAMPTECLAELKKVLERYAPISTQPSGTQLKQ